MLGFQAHATTPNIVEHVFWGLPPGPHAYKASTLLTDSSPQPSLEIFISVWSPAHKRLPGIPVYTSTDMESWPLIVRKESDIKVLLSDRHGTLPLL